VHKHNSHNMPQTFVPVKGYASDDSTKCYWQINSTFDVGIRDVRVVNRWNIFPL